MTENDNTPLVAQIVASYVSNNFVALSDLPSVIAMVQVAIGISSDSNMVATTDAPKQMEPAVPVKKSVTAEALACLCCGKQFKSLKRHLQTAHKFSPVAYRLAFGLNADYPIVAPNYSARRSSLAKSAEFGRKTREAPRLTKSAEKKPRAKKLHLK